MTQKLLKITYGGQAGAKKLNAYLQMPSDYVLMRRKIEWYLFREHQLPMIEFKTFWIDADRDEIDIVNQNDYMTFLSKCEDNMHMHVAAVVVVEAKTASASCSTDDPSNFVIHDAVECDGCGLNPLVGFRYKCIQCPNYDLCQGCEASHKHSEHMMVRMPTNNGPSVLESWVSVPGHCGRRSGRRYQRGHCPLFSESAQATSTPAETEGELGGHKESRRERRHNRRHGGVLSQFMDMMMNMPESNTPVAKPTTSTVDPEAAKEVPSPSTPLAAATTKTAAKIDASNVQETPKTTEPVAAPRSPKDAPEPSSAQTGSPQNGGGAATTPTTPIINLEHLSQIVPPEYMRAGIEIMNNFSEMFAKMIDPRESANNGFSETSTPSFGSASQAADAAAGAADAAAGAEDAAAKAADAAAKAAADAVNASTAAVNASTAAANATAAAKAAASSTGTLPKTPSVGTPVSMSSSSSTSTESSLENLHLLASTLSINMQQPKEDPERRRSESLDHDWQLIDNSGSTANTEPLINLETSTGVNTTPAADTAPTTAPTAATNQSFLQLGEQLRQYINEEQQREQVTAHTQTSQVNTVTTSTSTTTVPTNSTGTSPSPPEEKRGVLVYHTNEVINSSIHAMMAMGFSNEGAWLTQLLESVDGNIPAALDIMHSSQRSN